MIQCYTHLRSNETHEFFFLFFFTFNCTLKIKGSTLGWNLTIFFKQVIVIDLACQCSLHFRLVVLPWSSNNSNAIYLFAYALLINERIFYLLISHLLTHILLCTGALVPLKTTYIWDRGRINLLKRRKPVHIFWTSMSLWMKSLLTNFDFNNVFLRVYKRR